MYGREVLKQRKEYVHCAFLVGGSPVHHLNTKAIATKRTNRKEFLTWVILFASSHSHTKMIKSINENNRQQQKNKFKIHVQVLKLIKLN
jgi:aromatic ring-opening dioxygenase catalytic subunit (LigB family)